MRDPKPSKYTRRCAGCIYRRFASESAHGGIKICHYCLDTGEDRGVTAEECYKNKIHFETDPKNWRKVSC